MNDLRHKAAAFLLLAPFLLLAQQGYARGGVDDVREIVKKTKALYGSMPSGEISFEQVGEMGTSTGTIAYTGGAKYRLVLKKQTIVSDGLRTWTYVPDRKQVVVSKAAQGPGRLSPSDILTAFPGDYSPVLAGEEKVNGRAVWVVKCTPGAGRKIGDVTKATLYIDKATFRFQQIEIESPSAGRLKLRIISAQYGGKIPDSRFMFVPAAGVRVVDLTK